MRYDEEFIQIIVGHRLNCFERNVREGMAVIFTVCAYISLLCLSSSMLIFLLTALVLFM